MWEGCDEEAIYETTLDYPKIFVCSLHFDEHKRLARNHQCRIKGLPKTMRVEHPSFTQRQRRKNLKEKYL